MFHFFRWIVLTKCLLSQWRLHGWPCRFAHWDGDAISIPCACSWQNTLAALWDDSFQGITHDDKKYCTNWTSSCITSHYKQYCDVIQGAVGSSAIFTSSTEVTFVLGRVDRLFKGNRIPRNNISKCSRYIFRPTLVLVKSEMKNYNSIQILKLEISKNYNSLVFTVYKRLTITYYNLLDI